MAQDESKTRINVWLNREDDRKAEVIADEFFDGNKNEAIRFALRSLQLIPRGMAVPIGSFPTNSDASGLVLAGDPTGIIR